MANNFALAPGMVAQGVIDWSLPDNRRMYKAATAPFSTDEKYDLGTDGINTFIRDLRDRAFEFDCNAPLSIPTGNLDANNEQILHHLCDHPATPRDQVVAHVMTYHGQENEDAQKDYLLFQMLKNSLNATARSVMRLQEDQYMINDVPSGPLFFRAIYARVSVDTQAEIKALVGRLKTLDVAIIKEHNSDIVSFNDDVRDIINRLAEREHQSSDALSNIFDAYYKVPDLAFKRFVENIDHGHHYRNEPTTAQALLNATSTFYRDQVNTSKWMVEVDMTSEVIALKADLKSARDKISNNRASDKKKDFKNKDNKSKNNNKKKKDPKNLPPWVSERPKEGESEVKDHKGTKYYWCGKHGKWTSNSKHTTKTCKGLGLKGASDPNADKAAKAFESVVPPSQS